MTANKPDDLYRGVSPINGYTMALSSVAGNYDLRYYAIIQSDYYSLVALSGLEDKEIDTVLKRATTKGVTYHNAILELKFHLQYGGHIDNFYPIVKRSQKKKEPVLIVGSENKTSEPDYSQLFQELEQRYNQWKQSTRMN